MKLGDVLKVREKVTTDNATYLDLIQAGTGASFYKSIDTKLGDQVNVGDIVSVHFDESNHIDKIAPATFLETLLYNAY